VYVGADSCLFFHTEAMGNLSGVKMADEYYLGRKLLQLMSQIRAIGRKNSTFCISTYESHKHFLLL
jgi:hypothetical protein